MSIPESILPGADVASDDIDALRRHLGGIDVFRYLDVQRGELAAQALARWPLLLRLKRGDDERESVP